MTDLERKVRELLKAGELDDALKLVLGKLGAEILGFVCGVLGDDAGPDVYSGFSERLWKSFEGFEWRCALRTWVYMLARQEISRFHRGERRHVAGRVSLSEVKSMLAAYRKTQSILAERRDELTRLRDELPVEDRMLLILRLDRELSFNEIALALAENPDELRDLDKKRESARLRKRYELVTKTLIKRVRAGASDLDEPDDVGIRTPT